MIYLALYKGNREGRGFQVWKSRLSDWLVRKITKGPYSHCEIAVKFGGTDEYLCYSSSTRDGGVRVKQMPLPADKWDLIPIYISEQRVKEIYRLYKGYKYDWLGALGVVLPIKQRKSRFFCSEFCALVLDLWRPERYSPNSLAEYIRNRSD